MDRHFANLRGFFQGLLTFDGSAIPQLSALQSLEIVLASLLVAYIPLTHMSHFFTKWFTYHDVRWSDEPNLEGSGFDEKIAKQLEVHGELVRPAHPRRRQEEKLDRRGHVFGAGGIASA